jgi:hypothetical protein
VPALFGRPAPETGSVPFQHPARDSETPLGPDLDRFSALFLYVVLRALAAAPELWDAHAEGNPPEAFLIRRSDLAHPLESRVLEDLLRSPDREVVWLAGHLFRAARGELRDVPSLTELHRTRDEASRLLGDPVKSAEATARLKQIALESNPEHVRALLRAAPAPVAAPAAPQGVPAPVLAAAAVTPPAPAKVAMSVMPAVAFTPSSLKGRPPTTESIELDLSVSLDRSSLFDHSSMLDRDVSLDQDTSMTTRDISLERDVSLPGFPSNESLAKIEAGLCGDEPPPIQAAMPPPEQILELKRGQSRIAKLILALLVLLGLASLLLAMFVMRPH